MIDTRNLCHIREQAFKKYLIWEVHLADDHHLIAPIIFDAGCVQKDHFRKLHYMPTGPRNLIIKDEWFSDDKNINHEEMIRTLSETMKIKGWKINKVMREEIGMKPLPTISGIISEERRVINLSGLSNDLTGCSISGTTKLIDELVSTSFRYGEVKEVVKAFKAKRERNRKFLLYLNRQLIHHHHTSLFADIYSQPYPVLERFSKGTLSFFDRSRIALGHRSPLAGLFDFKMLKSICHVFLIEHKTHSKGMGFVGE